MDVLMAEQKQGKRKSWHTGKMWKVSVKDEYRRWLIKACCLTRSEAKMISDELNSVGIMARFRPHSYGVRRTA